MKIFLERHFLNRKNFYSYSLLLLAGAMLLFISSCKKYEEVTVSDNYSPPDYTVDSASIKLTIENYVIKTYFN
jgi:hypothetical protein